MFVVFVVFCIFLIFWLNIFLFVWVIFLLRNLYDGVLVNRFFILLCSCLSYDFLSLALLMFGVRLFFGGIVLRIERVEQYFWFSFMRCQQYFLLIKIAFGYCFLISGLVLFCVRSFAMRSVYFLVVFLVILFLLDLFFDFNFIVEEKINRQFCVVVS